MEFNLDLFILLFLYGLITTIVFLAIVRATRKGIVKQASGKNGKEQDDTKDEKVKAFVYYVEMTTIINNFNQNDMEKIQLTNGTEVSFPTAENDSWKFYYCDTYEEAQELRRTLTERGKYCEIDDNRLGWFVRVRKQD